MHELRRAVAEGGHSSRDREQDRSVSEEEQGRSKGEADQPSIYGKERVDNKS